MSLRIAIATPYDVGDDDTAEGDADAFAKLVSTELAASPVDVGYPRFMPSDHGVGAALPTLIIDILVLGKLAFLTIPAARTKVREAVEGWRQLKSDTDRLLKWLRDRHRVVSLSREAALLQALEYLERSGLDADDLEVLSATDVPGSDDYSGPDFESASDLLYVFVLRDSTGAAHLVAVTNQLQVAHNHRIAVGEAEP